MITFLNSITRNKIHLLKKPMIFEVIQSILQGQPSFIVLMVTLELLAPLIDPTISVNHGRLIQYTLWLLGAVVVLFLVGAMVYRNEHSAAYTITSEGRLGLGEHLRKLSMGFFKGRDPGDITALMMKDYTNVEILISHLLMGAIGAMVLPLVFMAFLLPFDWRMTLITLLPVPLAAIAAYLARLSVIHLGKIHIAAQNNASSRMLEYVDGMKNIKAYNLQGKKFERLHRSFKDLFIKSIKLEIVPGPLVMVGVWILNAGVALIMLAGTYFVIRGTLTIPYFLFFLIVGVRMYDPLSKLLANIAEINYFAISAKRLNNIFNTQPLPAPSSPKKTEKYNIEFDHVWFKYHQVDVLKDVSFHLPENTMTALVGPSGSGKSTMTRLIARFWDVNQGSIKIGDVPVTEMDSEYLLSKISIVFQDVYLFNQSILENIRVGKADATMEEVMAASKKARCHDFINALPQGYETIVGEGGSTLSGGDKQRISIARAILKDAPIVLLDEATASLDPENELFIQQAIDELIKGRTLVVIAHRLSTVTRANQILVLKDGVIAESGKHAELLNTENSVYQKMWNEQKSAHQWRLSSTSALN